MKNSPRMSCRIYSGIRHKVPLAELVEAKMQIAEQVRNDNTQLTTHNPQP